MDQLLSAGQTESSLYIPLSAGPAPAPEKPSGGRARKGVLWGSIAGVVLALGAGGYFAYSRGYISIPFLSPKSDELFSRLIASLSKIDNAQYTLKATLKSQPRQAGVKSIFPSSTERRALEQDEERKSDLAQIRTALTLYADDHEAAYPTSLDALTSEYLSVMPTDPEDKSAYNYQACDGNKHYLLSTGLDSGEYYFFTDTASGLSATTLPKCGGNTNVSKKSFWSPLILPAYAQATTFSVESVGSEIGLDEPRTSDFPLVNVLSIFGLGDTQAIVDIFPTDIDTSAEVTFYTEADKKLKDADALLKMAATYTGGDLTAQFDVEGRKIGTTVYGIVRKFPGIPYISQYITPLKDKWIKITPDDGNSFLTDDVWQETSIKDAVEKTKEQLQLVLEGEAFTVDKKMGTDTIAGVQSVHYRLAIHPDKFKGIFEKIIADRKAKKLDTGDLESVMDELDQPNVQASIQRFIDNSTVDIWIDKAQGLLRQISWNLVIVPPDDSTKLKDKQFSLGLTLTLDKVNKKVSVGKPGDSIDYNEAERLVTGVSVEEQQFNRQRSRVNRIRSGLTGIYSITNAYPDSIDNLEADWKQAIKDCEADNKNANINGSAVKSKYCGYYYDSGQSFSSTDYYTNKPYTYTSTGNDYALKYEMRLDFESTDSDFSYGSYYKDEYAEGTNTATSKDLSTENETASEKAAKERAANTNANRNTNATTNTNTSTTSYWTQLYPCLSGYPSTSLDADTDGIKDYNEVYTYYTSPCKIDTDGDGHSDATEINNGYNPNGPGKLNYGNTNTSFAPTNTSVTVKPVITNVKITFGGGQAYATWTTDIPSNTIAYYRNTTKTGDPTRDAYTYNSVTNHQAIFPVVVGNAYEYSIASCPGADDRFSSTVCAQSATLSFYVSN